MFEGGCRRGNEVKGEQDINSELYLDQRAPDDPAHVQPPLCNVGVVLVQVGRESQQMRLEVFCREKSRRVRDAFMSGT